MTDLFFLQDSRSTVGSRAMFWRNGGGYTSNLDEAEQFTRERAVTQYQSRETDLPWPVAYVRNHAEVGVDCQYVCLSDAAPFSSTDSFYASYKGDWDGNDLIWYGVQGPSSNLSMASAISAETSEVLRAAEFIVWPANYITTHSRPVVRAIRLDHKQALRAVALKLPKAKREKSRFIDRLNCHGCGRFLSEWQRYGQCPNCEASNAP